MKKTTKIITSVTLLLVGAFAAHAQTASTTSMTTTTTNSSYRAADEFGPHKGEWEITLGGSGTSNKQMDNSLGGVNLSLGYYLTNKLEIAARQSANYASGPTTNGTNFNGSTFIALDQHFGESALRPFLGINAGGLYGDNTSDTLAAGLEGGLKYYVKPTTFLFALAEYEWTFRNSHDASDNFHNGAFLWTVGVGFNL